MLKLKVLLGIFVFLAIAGCKEYDGLRMRFNTEKLFYKAEKGSQTLLVSPGQLNSERVDSVLKYYEDVIEYANSNIDRAGEQDSAQAMRLAGVSKMKIAELLVLDRRYVRGYRTYKEAVADYPDDPRVSFQASLRAASILEQIGDNRGAIGEYEALFEKYPLSKLDSPPVKEYVEAPSRVAILYRKLNDNKSLKRSLNEARQFFQDGIEHFKEYPLLVKRFKLEIAGAYSLEGRYDDGVTVLNSIKDAGGMRPLDVRLQVGREYLNNIKNYGAARKEFRDIISDFPDSLAAARAQYGLAMTYYRGKDYKTARSEFTRLEKDYPQAIGLHSRGHWYYANSFEDEKRWDRALVEYRYIGANFPESPEALNVPLHIAKHYQAAGDRRAASRAFDDAVDEYRKLINRFGKSPVSSQASANIARCYILQKKWNDAVEALLETANKYTETITGRDSRLMAADIAEAHLKDNKKAVEIYRDFLETYPWISIRDDIERKIERLGG